MNSYSKQLLVIRNEKYERHEKLANEMLSHIRNIQRTFPSRREGDIKPTIRVYSNFLSVTFNLPKFDQKLILLLGEKFFNCIGYDFWEVEEELEKDRLYYRKWYHSDKPSIYLHFTFERTCRIITRPKRKPSWESDEEIIGYECD